MRFARLCIAAAVLLTGAGCRSFSFGPLAERSAASPSMSRDQVVALVNRNVSGGDGQSPLTSWRCMQAKFQMAPMPVAAEGTVIVEAPQNFRLRVAHPIGGGDELDVGSNAREFWIWQKDMEALLTARHDDMSLALKHFRIPFQPDWIMEVMGVTPIEAEQYELRPAGSRQVELVADARSPTGAPCRKIIRVDARRGWVTAHELWNADGDLIASAELSQHEVDPRTKALLPRKIRIHWPEADLDLRITLKHVEVNPPQLPEMVWQLPHKNGGRLVDMGEYARRQEGLPAKGPADTGIAAGAAPTTPPAAAVLPVNRSVSESSEAAARPFPGTSPGRPPVPGETFPQRGSSTPLEPTGRVRLNEFGP